MRTKHLARCALLTALALILSWVESLIPALAAVPGMKLGLTNIVVLIALYRLGTKEAAAISLIRILLVSVLFGNLFSLAYSVTGGVLSFLVMLLLKKTDRFGMTGVSIAGGIAHNAGQILAAVILMGTRAILSYLPVLWISGIIAGAAVGLVGGITSERLPEKLFRD